VTTIAVLGAGVMATAAATPLTDNGRQVHVVGTHLDREEIDSMRAKGVHPRLARPTLEGAAAIRVIGEALPELTERGLVGVDEFPLLHRLYEVIALERPVDIPWSKFFPGKGGGTNG
jgi:hypothetical protein